MNDCDQPTSDDQVGPTGQVTHCVCQDVSFAQLLVWCDRRRERGQPASVAAIGEHFGCGRGCGLCTPYLYMMLQTRRTRFTINTSTPGTSTTPD